MKKNYQILKYKDKYIKYLFNFKDEKSRAYTTLMLTFFSLSIFGFFAINPTVSTIAQLKKELSDNEFIDKRLTEKISNLNSLQNQYSILENDLSLANSAIPQKPDPAVLTAQIKTLANDSNFKLDRIQVFEVELTKLPNDKTNDFFSFAFSIGGEGSDEEISTFISYILGFERLVSLESLSMTKNKNQTSKLDLRGKVYFQK